MIFFFLFEINNSYGISHKSQVKGSPTFTNNERKDFLSRFMSSIFMNEFMSKIFVDSRVWNLQFVSLALFFFLFSFSFSSYTERTYTYIHTTVLLSKNCLSIGKL